MAVDEMKRIPRVGEPIVYLTSDGELQFPAVVNDVDDDTIDLLFFDFDSPSLVEGVLRHEWEFVTPEYTGVDECTKRRALSDLATENASLRTQLAAMTKERDALLHANKVIDGAKHAACASRLIAERERDNAIAERNEAKAERAVGHLTNPADFERVTRWAITDSYGAYWVEPHTWTFQRGDAALFRDKVAAEKVFALNPSQKSGTPIAVHFRRRALGGSMSDDYEAHQRSSEEQFQFDLDTLRSDRDAWKARAEKAEAELVLARIDLGTEIDGLTDRALRAEAAAEHNLELMVKARTDATIATYQLERALAVIEAAREVAEHSDFIIGMCGGTTGDRAERLSAALRALDGEP